MKKPLDVNAQRSFIWACSCAIGYESMIFVLERTVYLDQLKKVREQLDDCMKELDERSERLNQQAQDLVKKAAELDGVQRKHRDILKILGVA